jgi:uracil-DNA glycosylase family 4
MHISANLSALALRQLIGGSCRAVGLDVGEGAVDGVVHFLTRHFSDHSQKLSEALRHSNERAWRALEVALAGNTLLDRCKLLVASGDDKAFREQIQPFLTSCPLGELHGRDNYRQLCLTELRTARKAGLLAEGSLDPAALARKAGAFARFSDPGKLLDAEAEALLQMSGDLRSAGHVNLAELVALRPQHGSPLLVVAARYFFRRAVEQDDALFQGLAFAQLERLQQDQEAGFSGLERLLGQQGARLEELLGEVRVAVIETRDAVLDVRAEQRRQGDQVRDLYQAVLDMQTKLDFTQREVRAGDSLSLRNDTERALVKQLVRRYRDLPEGQRERMPALLNAIGKLEIAAGDFTGARSDFSAVAGLVTDAPARAEAHANAYRAALEQRDWETALVELREAVRLDSDRFSPFPMAKYRPSRILGAGGFGVAFLCEHRFLKAPVVVKTLGDVDLERGVDAVFTEAQVLRQLDHPAIIRVQDCGFASLDGESRPYLVMDYFEGVTLEEQARKEPLSVADLRQVGRLMASGLEAAHGQGILHRDVKPANVLVRRSPDGSWEVKLIDFGLAQRLTGRETFLASTRSIAGTSIAGTLEYAAPEQMGKLTGVSVGPTSDLYGFARTCCFALFQTPQPLMRHWRSLPPELAELLETCLEEQPDRRPKSFGTVIPALGGPTPAKEPAPAEATITVPVTPAPPATGVFAPPVEETAAEASRRHELTVVSGQVAGCTRCTGLARTRTRTVFGTGPLDPEIFFLGEAPGADEDRTGEPFVGAAGKVFNGLLEAVGLERSQVYLANLLKCRPPGNRKPEPAEVGNCREYLLRQLEILRPRSICLLGASAVQGLLGTTESVGRLRGRLQEYRGIPVVCTYHPAYLLPGRSPERRGDVIADLNMLLRRVRQRK